MCRGDASVQGYINVLLKARTYLLCKIVYRSIRGHRYTRLVRPHSNCQVHKNEEEKQSLIVVLGDFY